MPLKRDPKTVTETLKETMERTGKNLHELSRMTGLLPEQLSRFLKGERGLHSDSIDKLCQAFNLELVPRRRPRKRK